VGSLYAPIIARVDPHKLSKDPKTQLQEFLQARRLRLPQYTIVATEGEAHEQHFKVECHIPELNIRVLGEGASRRKAEQEAARLAYAEASGREGGDMSENTPFRTGFIAIVGRPNVGKSTLLNALVGEKISITSNKPQTTRHRIVGIHTDDTAQWIFVDTPGFQLQYRNALNRTMNRTVTEALSGVDVVVFVVEALHYDERDETVVKLLPRDRPVILAVNKTDTVKEKLQLLPFIDRMAKVFPFAEIVPVSATTHFQIPELLAAIRPYLPEGPPLYDKEDITDRSERFLAAEAVREKIFRLLGDEIPYSTTVVIEKFEEEGRLRRIHAAIIVDKESQKAIVIGKGGERLKAIGSEARRDMERLFGGKVYLELWVKVRSGWADDERAVKSLGYSE
jgi:GTP-binding protein Era